MESIVDNNPMPAVEKLEITFAETVESERPESKVSDVSGRGDGPCVWSLTEEQQVCNLKENWKRAFTLTRYQRMDRSEHERFRRSKEIMEDALIDDNPLLATVVEQLRSAPCLDSFELKMTKEYYGPFVSGAKMTSLDLAILMGDLKMVQKILEKSFLPKKIIEGSIVDMRDLSTPWIWELDTGKEFLKEISDERALLYKMLFFKSFFKNSSNSKMIGFSYTPLHLAVVGGNSDIVDVLLEKHANVNATDWLSQTPSNLACKSRRVDVLAKLLKKDEEQEKDPLHVAMRSGDIDFIKKLPSFNVNALDKRKMTPLHYLASSRFNDFQVSNIIEYLAKDKALDVKALDENGFSAIYVVVLYCNTKVVIALLDALKERMRLNEICDKKHRPLIQIAFEGGEKFKDIEGALMECDSVKGYMERLYRDRQVYVDAANALLVGAALIASVTFASWLQPPLNYTSYFGEGYSSSIPTPSTSDVNYVDVQHNIALRAFWIFNALSFYFAIATVVFGAQSVLPRSHLFIKKTVEKLRTNLLVTSILLACSVLFVIIAFAIAGTIVLTPLLKYQWFMIVPTMVGGMVCIISLVFLVKNIAVDYNVTNTHNDSEILEQKDRDYLEGKGYFRGADI